MLSASLAVMMWLRTGMTALLLLFGAPATGASSPAPPSVGEEYEIVRSYETSQRSSDGSSSGSSSGRDALLERVIGVRADGLELEYDHPKGTKPEDKARQWQLPARVFRPWSGPAELINAPELERRVSAWLKANRWDRRVCGQWIFTWNAFRIDCDPATVLQTVQAFDLRVADLREGGLYRAPEALSAGTLRKTATRPNGSTFIVLMEVDPEAVRRTEAESDVAVGEIMRKPITLESALRKRALETVSGTITVTLEADSVGNVWRRTKVMEVRTRIPGGASMSKTAKETVDRRRL
jgi:hypothetical protein